jgi:CRP-like cAMP-binding protein
MAGPQVQEQQPSASLGSRLMALPEAEYVQQRAKGQIIYHNEAPCSHLYFLREGRIRLSQHQADGRFILRAMVFPGAVFGEEGLFADSPHRERAEAVQGVAYVQIPLSSVRQGLAKDPELARLFVHRLGQSLKRLRDRQVPLLFHDARTRIVGFLHQEAEERGEAIGYECLVRDFGYTHQDIAHLVGTSRQTVTMVLNGLKDNNLIYLDRRNLLIRDIKRLV